MILYKKSTDRKTGTFSCIAVYTFIGFLKCLPDMNKMVFFVLKLGDHMFLFCICSRGWEYLVFFFEFTCFGVFENDRAVFLEKIYYIVNVYPYLGSRVFLAFIKNKLHTEKRDILRG